MPDISVITPLYQEGLSLRELRRQVVQLSVFGLVGKYLARVCFRTTDSPRGSLRGWIEDKDRS